MKYAVKAEDVFKTYGSGQSKLVALDHVSLGVAEGSFLAIMGPSGSGKSTLMQCLAGLDSIDSGRIEVGGRDITNASDAALTRLRREHVGFVFQSFNLVSTLTARQNIVLPMKLARRRVDRQLFDQVTTQLGIKNRLDHKPHEMSGGQQQRVAIARALIAQPTVIFADEPTGNLDSVSSAEVLRILRNSVDEFRQTVIMVTHDPSAAAYADEAIILTDGRITSTLVSPTLNDVVRAMQATTQQATTQQATTTIKGVQK